MTLQVEPMADLIMAGQMTAGAWDHPGGHLGSIGAGINWRWLTLAKVS